MQNTGFMQGCEFAFFALSLKIAQKWAAMSKSLLLLLTKEQLSISLKKSKVSDLLVIRGNCSQKTSDSQKTYFWYFLTVFHGFSLFLCPRVNHFRRYLLSFSFLTSESIFALLLTKTSNSLEKPMSKFPALVLCLDSNMLL